MKTINIFLTMKDKKLLNDIKNKYHISYSTICNIVIPHMFILCGEKIEGDIYKGEKTYKTSIKPKTKWTNINSKYWSNAIKVFIRKEIEKYKRAETIKYIDKENKIVEYPFEKEKQSRTTRIYNEFQNTYEENWNGNQLCRFIPKFMKQNPEYCKKLLKVE